MELLKLVRDRVNNLEIEETSCGICELRDDKEEKQKNMP